LEVSDEMKESGCSLETQTIQTIAVSMVPAAAIAAFRFDLFERGTLLKEGIKRKPEPCSIQEILLSHPNELVKRSKVQTTQRHHMITRFVRDDRNVGAKVGKMQVQQATYMTVVGQSTAANILNLQWFARDCFFIPVPFPSALQNQSGAAQHPLIELDVRDCRQ
jgi:hypothetical protein